jgi:hypothetical protein
MTLATRIAFQTAMRAASVELLTDFASDAGIKLQVYPGRPASVFPPCAFVDRIRERLTYLGPTFRQRTPQADIVVIHGDYDSKEAANNKDAFVDAFLDWALDRYHAAGANTLVAVVATEDDPNYVPDWLPAKDGRQPMYYATLVQLEGLALD